MPLLASRSHGEIDGNGRRAVIIQVGGGPIIAVIVGLCGRRRIEQVEAPRIVRQCCVEVEIDIVRVGSARGCLRLGLRTIRWLVQRQANGLHWQLALVQVQRRRLVHDEGGVFPPGHVECRLGQVARLVRVVMLRDLSMGVWMIKATLGWVDCGRVRVKSYVSLLLLDRCLLRIIARQGHSSAPTLRGHRLHAVTRHPQVRQRLIGGRATLVAKNTLNRLVLSRCGVPLSLLITPCLLRNCVVVGAHTSMVVWVCTTSLRLGLPWVVVVLWLLGLCGLVRLRTRVEKLVEIKSFQYVLRFGSFPFLAR